MRALAVSGGESVVLKATAFRIPDSKDLNVSAEVEIDTFAPDVFGRSAITGLPGIATAPFASAHEAPKAAAARTVPVRPAISWQPDLPSVAVDLPAH